MHKEIIKEEKELPTTSNEQKVTSNKQWAKSFTSVCNYHWQIQKLLEYCKDQKLIWTTA